MAAKQKPNPNSKGKPVNTTRYSKGPAPAELFRTNTFQGGFWLREWPAGLLLMVLAVALYYAAVSFGYVLDDQMTIWENTFVQKGFAGLREIFAYDSFMGYFKEQKFLLEGGRYRPLSLATFAIEVEFFGKNHPGASHLINILLYGFTGLLIYRILSGLLPLRSDGRWYFGLPFLASVFFIAHPLHVEAVANIKGRDEILALLCSLGALYASLKYFDTRKSIWLFLSGFLLFLGMLSKENAITFLAVIPLTLWFFARIPVDKTISASLPLILAFLLFFMVRYMAMGYVLNHGKSMTDLMNNPFLEMNGGEKYATIFLTLGWYLKLLVFPHPLTHDYYPYHVPKVNWSDWRPLLSLALHLGMGIWAVLNLKRRKLPAYAILYYLITLSIVSNLFVSIGTFMNERFIYMSSLAYCLVLAWLLARQLPLWLKEKEDRLYILGAGLVVLVLGFYTWRTYTRVPDWKSGETLNKSAINISSKSARSHCYYAIALYENDYKKATNADEKKAIVDTMDVHIRKALDIYHNYGAAWVMRGVTAIARFDLDHQMDRLFNEFDGCLDVIPNNPTFRSNMDAYMNYLATNGGNPNKIQSFAYREGYERFYLKQKDYPNAIKLLEYGLKTQTEDERILKALAEVYAASGNTAKAAEMQTRAAKAATY